MLQFLTRRTSVDSWKTRTYRLRISKWKAGVRSFLIRNHLSPYEVIKPSPAGIHEIFKFYVSTCLLLPHSAVVKGCPVQGITKSITWLEIFIHPCCIVCIYPILMMVMMMMTTLITKFNPYKLQLTYKWPEKAVHKFLFGRITRLNDFYAFRVTQDNQWLERANPQTVTSFEFLSTFLVEQKSRSIRPCLRMDWQVIVIKSSSLITRNEARMHRLICHLLRSSICWAQLFGSVHCIKAKDMVKHEHRTL